MTPDDIIPWLFVAMFGGFVAFLALMLVGLTVEIIRHWRQYK